MNELSVDSKPTDSRRDFTHLSIWSERLLAVRKQWHLVALAVVVGLGLALVYLVYATRYYRSQATLMVQRENGTNAANSTSADVQELYRTEYMRTQMEIVKDPDTLKEAYANIGILLAAQNRTPEEIEKLLPELSWTDNLDVRALPNALIFRIEYEHPDGKVASLVVEQVVDAFIQKERKTRKDRVERSTESQKAARDAALKEMQEASATIEAFQIANKLVDPTISNSIIRQQHDDLAQRRNNLMAALDYRRALHDHCQILTHSAQDDAAVLAQYAQLDFGDQAPAVRALELMLVTEQTTLAQLTFDHGPKHWEVVLEQGKIDALNQLRLAEYQRLANRVMATWEADQETLKRYNAELEELEKHSLEYQTATTRYQIMQKDLDAKTDYFSRMKDALASLENQLSSDTQAVIQQGSVYPWPRPVRPNNMVTVAIAFMVSLLIGLFLAMSVEYLDDSIKHPDEMAPRTGFTPLGLIPHVADDVSPIEKINYILRHPQTSFSESFRSLRVNLIISLGSRDITNGVIAVTSSVPREGKSLVTSNLAASFVQSGKKTLLLQADLRRPTSAEHYGLKQADIANRGTTAALTSQAEFGQCVHMIHENLYLMPCGTCPTNPSELIGAHMKELVAWARTQFDMVIIDTPPLINVSDTLLITPLCDGVLMVIHGGSTSGRLVRQTQDMLVRGNALVLGAVLNDVSSAVERHHRFAERYGIGMYSYYSNYYTKYGYSSGHEVDLNPAASSGSNKAMD